MSEDSFIALKNVSFAYGKRPILKNISLEIPKGQLAAIMGGSGSGKTTLLRLIAGQCRPQSGEVWVNGQRIDQLSEKALYQHRRHMGMLFQFGALFTDLNVFENVAFPLREHLKLPERMITDLTLMKLSAVGLRGTEKLMPQELSGGMARRIALARAIAMDPELMLYDEPFTGLDPISLGTIAMLIKKLNDTLGTTAVMVTHDIHLSLNIVDQVFFVANGEIIATGSPAEVRASDSPWVKQFINGQADGPVEMAYPNKQTFAHDLGLRLSKPNTEATC